MRTLQQQRKREVSTDLDSDMENQMPPANKRPTKKTRRVKSRSADSSTDDFQDLKELIAKSEKRRAEQNKEMVETLKESTRVYERTSERYLDVLQLLIQN